MNTLINMFPHSMTCNIRNSHRAYLELLCNVFLFKKSSSQKRFNLSDLLFIQFRHSVFRALIVMPILSRMFFIFFVSHPFKILKRVIRFVQVFMVNFMLYTWSWGQKTHGNQLMHKIFADFSIFVQRKLIVPMFHHIGLQESSFGFPTLRVRLGVSPYFSNFGRCIKTFVSWNFFHTPNYISLLNLV